MDKFSFDFNIILSFSHHFQVQHIIPRSNMPVTSIGCCKILTFCEFVITLFCLFGFIFNHKNLTDYTNSDGWSLTFILVNVLILTYLVKEYVGLIWNIFGIVVFGCVIRTVIACLVGILFIHIAKAPLKEYNQFLKMENWREDEDYSDFR